MYHQNLRTIHPSRYAMTYYNYLNQLQQAILWGMQFFEGGTNSLRQASEITLPRTMHLGLSSIQLHFVASLLNLVV